MESIHAIKNFLYKDVISMNESKKAAVILRFTAMIMCCYFLVVLLYYFFVPQKALLSAIPCFLMTAVVFYFTYSDQTKQALMIANVITIFWIVFMVYMLGWDSGVQHFIFVLLITYFTTSLSNFRIKILYAVSLVILRLVLYRYTWTHAPVDTMPMNLHIAFQIINTITICFMIVVMMLLYTKDSRMMEEKLIMYNEKLKRQASRDPLTGLQNRRSVLEYLEDKTECYRTGKYNALSVAIADIDFFKKVNDVYGHECGDLVLKELSELFENYMQDIGIVGRWGGEEFLFVFNDKNGDEAYTELLHLQCLIKKMEIQYQQESFHITLTYGLTEYDSHKEIDMIIKEADEKLYMGKKSGRNKIVY